MTLTLTKKLGTGSLQAIIQNIVRQGFFSDIDLYYLVPRSCIQAYLQAVLGKVQAIHVLG